MRWLWGEAIGPGGDCGELDHMPARGGNGSREVFPCGDVGAFHPVSYAKIEVWILCDISQLKNVDLQFSFSDSMKAEQRTSGATSGPQAVPLPPLCGPLCAALLSVVEQVVCMG